MIKAWAIRERTEKSRDHTLLDGPLLLELTPNTIRLSIMENKKEITVNLIFQEGSLIFR